jgi:hypothetical protein
MVACDWLDSEQRADERERREDGNPSYDVFSVSGRMTASEAD